MFHVQKLEVILHNRPKIISTLLKAVELLDVCDSLDSLKILENVMEQMYSTIKECRITYLLIILEIL